MKPLAAILGVSLFLPIANARAGGALSPGESHVLPAGYKVLSKAEVSVGRPVRLFSILALGRQDEGDRRAGDAPRRPLLVFERKGGRLLPAGRNDHVVMKADEGWQCDPFLDGNATIAVKGRYFTVENGVACGQHWTDYITFRFDDRSGGFVFDNERLQLWSFNKSTEPDAEALVPDGPPAVTRDRPGHLTPFSVWRPAK